MWPPGQRLIKGSCRGSLQSFRSSPSGVVSRQKSVWLNSSIQRHRMHAINHRHCASKLVLCRGTLTDDPRAIRRPQELPAPIPAGVLCKPVQSYPTIVQTRMHESNSKGSDRDQDIIQVAGVSKEVGCGPRRSSLATRVETPPLLCDTVTILIERRSAARITGSARFDGIM